MVDPKVFVAPAGLFDNVLSDYLWVRAVLLTGRFSLLVAPVPTTRAFCHQQCVI